MKISDGKFIDESQAIFAEAQEPAWFRVGEDSLSTVSRLSTESFWFLYEIIDMVKGEGFAYGTVYSVLLDGSPRGQGEWHYDLGEYSEAGATRFVTTWRSDGVPIGNLFIAPGGRVIQAPNLYVTRFHEGKDLHCSPEVPGNPSARGVFMAATLYREGEPANLECPRLAPLRDDGSPFAQLARTFPGTTRRF